MVRRVTLHLNSTHRLWLWFASDGVVPNWCASRRRCTACGYIRQHLFTRAQVQTSQCCQALCSSNAEKWIPPPNLSVDVPLRTNMVISELEYFRSKNVVKYSAAPELAKGISDILGVPLGKATIGRFNDGECNIQVCSLCTYVHACVHVCMYACMHATHKHAQKCICEGYIIKAYLWTAY